MVLRIPSSNFSLLSFASLGKGKTDAPQLGVCVCVCVCGKTDAPQLGVCVCVCVCVCVLETAGLERDNFRVLGVWDSFS